jgi:hypothetical protein
VRNVASVSWSNGVFVLPSRIRLSSKLNRAHSLPGLRKRNTLTRARDRAMTTTAMPGQPLASKTQSMAPRMKNCTPMMTRTAPKPMRPGGGVDQIRRRVDGLRSFTQPRGSCVIRSVKRKAQVSDRPCVNDRTAALLVEGGSSDC